MYLLGRERVPGELSAKLELFKHFAEKSLLKRGAAVCYFAARRSHVEAPAPK